MSQVNSDTFHFNSPDLSCYAKRRECPKCHSQVEVRVMDGCTHGMEAHCHMCGKTIYLFAREISKPFVKMGGGLGKGPTKVYTKSCMCHLIFGGSPCKITFKTKAPNALYSLECSYRTKKQIGINRRELIAAQELRRKESIMPPKKSTVKKKIEAPKKKLPKAQ